MSVVSSRLFHTLHFRIMAWLCILSIAGCMCRYDPRFALTWKCYSNCLFLFCSIQVQFKFCLQYFIKMHKLFNAE